MRWFLSLVYLLYLLIAASGALGADADVRLEFDAWSLPGTEPGGLSATLCSGDNVKVYERVTLHPDTINDFSTLPDGPLYREGRKLKIRGGSNTSKLEKAVSSFNEGKLADALEQFADLGGSLAGLLGRAYVLGDLNYYEKFRNDDFKKLAEQFSKAAAANPRDEVLNAYAAAAGWFAGLEMKRGKPQTTAAVRLRELGPQNNPFFHKSQLHEARYTYWRGKEIGRKELVQEAVKQMKALRELWPENVILKQYTGEKIPWGDNLNADTKNHPAWAAYLHEAYIRQIKIMEHFLKERQTPDGQLGGGYGDDVELLRTWNLVAAISTGAVTVRQGIERLCEGVWDTALSKGKGYDNIFNDVEHSAEPSADSLPGMLILRYNDPLWIKRNLQTCQTIKDYYMAIDQKGYPRFRSSYFGDLRHEKEPKYGGDTGYCARAMKHFFWAAWQGDQQAKDWYVRWADGWRASTMARIGTKLPGVVPLSIWYPSGDIVPPVQEKQWYDEELNYWPQQRMIYDVFFAAYYLTGDSKFLEPFKVAMEKAASSPAPAGTPERGSRDWQFQEFYQLPYNVYGQQNFPALYKWLTGDGRYDSYTAGSKEPALSYLVDKNLDSYLKSFQNNVRSLRYNLDLQTTEVLSTDRAALGAANEVFRAYTGAITGLHDASTPTFAVTYDTPSPDFAALVTAATDEHLRIWLYNFERDPMPIGLKLWRLKPGKYTLSQGDGNGKPVSSQVISVLHRAEGPTINVPPGKVWEVELKFM